MIERIVSEREMKSERERARRQAKRIEMDEERVRVGTRVLPCAVGFRRPLPEPTSRSDTSNYL